MNDHEENCSAFPSVHSSKLTVSNKNQYQAARETKTSSSALSVAHFQGRPLLDGFSV